MEFLFISSYSEIMRPIFLNMPSLSGGGEKSGSGEEIKGGKGFTHCKGVRFFRKGGKQCQNRKKGMVLSVVSSKDNIPLKVKKEGYGPRAYFILSGTDRFEIVEKERSAAEKGGDGVLKKSLWEKKRRKIGPERERR